MNIFRFSFQKNEDSVLLQKRYMSWRIRTFLAVYIGYCGFYLTRKNLSPALHIFSEELGIDVIDLGIITAAFSVTYGIGKFFCGILADRVNIRFFIASGLLLSSVINLFYGSLQNKALLVFFWGLNGFCQAIASPSIAKTLVYWFSPSERAEKWTWWGSSQTVGTLLAGALVAFLLKYSPDWRAVFYVPGLLGILVSVYMFCSLRDKPVSVGLPPVEEYHNDPLPVVLEKKNVSQWNTLKKYIFINPYIWYLSIALCCIYFVRLSTLDWIVKFLYDMRGFDKVQVVWFYNIMPLFGVPGGILGGYIVTHFFKGRCAPVILIYLLILLFAIYGFYTFASPAHMGLTCLFAAAIGFFVEAPKILIGGVMLSRVTVQEAMASADGFSSMVSYLFGTALGANLGAALLIDKWGWGVLYGACAVCVIFAIFFVLITWKKETSLTNS